MNNTIVPRAPTRNPAAESSNAPEVMDQISDYIVANSGRTGEGLVYRGRVPFDVRYDPLEETVVLVVRGRETLLAGPQHPRCRPLTHGSQPITVSR